MKKIFLLIIQLSIGVYSQNSSIRSGSYGYDINGSVEILEDTSYIPLQNNNRYQYILTIYGGGTFFSYLRYGIVSNDTLMNNHKYYLHSIREVNHWLRYSEEDNKLYKWMNESDLIYMDFNKEPGDTFIHLDSAVPATVLGGDTSLFSMTIPYKGFRLPLIGPSGTNKRELFAKGIGIFYSRFEMPSSIGSTNSTYSLIMAIQYDSSGNSHNFTNHIRPQISVTPITLIDSSKFKLNYSVTHEFDRIYPPGHVSLSFIEFIKLESYYSKKDSVIELPVINASEVMNLDTLLMKNGFSFNYRIVAKDKGIIPETSYAPDTGYYKCVWNGPTEIEDNNQSLQTFSLSQNYPNPFNPSTKISWQSPVGGHQTLKVYDVLGREVAILINESKDAGSYEVEFDGSQLASGVYYYRLKVGEFVETKKMMVIK